MSDEPYNPEMIADWLTGGLARTQLTRTTLTGSSEPVNVLVSHVPGGWQPVAILVDPELQEKLTAPRASQLPPCPNCTHD